MERNLIPEIEKVLILEGKKTSRDVECPNLSIAAVPDYAGDELIKAVKTVLEEVKESGNYDMHVYGKYHEKHLGFHGKTVYYIVTSRKPEDANSPQS